MHVTSASLRFVVNTVSTAFPMKFNESDVRGCGGKKSKLNKRGCTFIRKLGVRKCRNTKNILRLDLCRNKK